MMVFRDHDNDGDAGSESHDFESEKYTSTLIDLLMAKPEELVSAE